MIIRRDKNYSGYQPTHGIGYIDSAQLRQNVDDGIYRVADHLEKVVDKAGDIHPVVSNASKKWRNRVVGYTKPIKKIINRRKKNDSQK